MDLKEPDWTRHLSPHTLLIWMNRGGTITQPHYDIYHNLICMYHGAKKFAMYPPYEHHLLYLEGNYMDPELKTDKPDIENYPLFKHATRWVAEAKAGDCMYLPRGWIHAVHSSKCENLGTNFWFSPNEILPFITRQLFTSKLGHRHTTLQYLAQKHHSQKEYDNAFNDLSRKRRIPDPEESIKYKWAHELFLEADTNRDRRIQYKELVRMSRKDSVMIHIKEYWEELMRAVGEPYTAYAMDANEFFDQFVEGKTKEMDHAAVEWRHAGQSRYRPTTSIRDIETGSGLLNVLFARSHLYLDYIAAATPRLNLRFTHVPVTGSWPEMTEHIRHMGPLKRLQYFWTDCTTKGSDTYGSCAWHRMILHRKLMGMYSHNPFWKWRIPQSKKRSINTRRIQTGRVVPPGATIIGIRRG